MRNILLIIASTYCLLWTDRSVAQTAAIDNKPWRTTTFRAIPKGTGVLGVFGGRPPCAGLTRQLNLTATGDCVKLKWELVLYRDSITRQPANYILSMTGAGDMVYEDGGSYRRKILNGKWSVGRGIPSNASAIVYNLELPGAGRNLYLLKGDDNVLFILDESKEYRVGNEDFSYTLNRLELVPGTK